MKVEDMRKSSEDELKKELAALLREQFNLRLQLNTAQLSRHHLLRNVRRSIAQIRTILAEKQSSRVQA